MFFMLDDDAMKKNIQMAKRGDVESFESLILSCKGKAYNLAYRYLKNEEDAMDALQESFIKIYRGLPNFNEQSKFETWVYRIVANTCMDMLRKAKVRPVAEALEKETDQGEAYSLEIADTGPLPEEQLLRRETGEYLMACMDKLSSEHREIIIMRDINGFSYTDIAEVLNCGEGTVKSRLSRARQRLREIYVTGDG